MTLLYTDPLFLRHDTGPHVEIADRLRAITARRDRAGLAARCTAGTFRPLAEEDVRAIHDPRQVEFVKRVAAAGGGRLDPDTVVSADSFRVALAAAGAACAAVDAVVS